MKLTVGYAYGERWALKALQMRQCNVVLLASEEEDLDKGDYLDIEIIVQPEVYDDVKELLPDTKPFAQYGRLRVLRMQCRMEEFRGVLGQLGVQLDELIELGEYEVPGGRPKYLQEEEEGD